METAAPFREAAVVVVVAGGEVIVSAWVAARKPWFARISLITRILRPLSLALLIDTQLSCWKTTARGMLTSPG
jgi:hypothetical protein